MYEYQISILIASASTNLTLARRRGVRLVTFDAALATLAQGRDVELLTVL